LLLQALSQLEKIEQYEGEIRALIEANEKARLDASKTEL
jgi:hypothetical protein